MSLDVSLKIILSLAFGALAKGKGFLWAVVVAGKAGEAAAVVLPLRQASLVAVATGVVCHFDVVHRTH